MSKQRFISIVKLLSCSGLLLCILVAVQSCSMPTRGPSRSSSVTLATRDIGAINVGCDPVTFIVSLNDDDDNDNGRADRKQRGSPSEDNLREFRFNLAGKDEVFVAEPVIMANGDPAINVRVRAYKADKQTPFDFTRNHRVPVTMYLEGIGTSTRRNDLGFEYQYFRNGIADCGSGAQGTVVDVDATFTADRGGGSSFTKANKMLITGTGRANATVTPRGIGTTRWSYDGQAQLPNATQLSTAFNAQTVYTPDNLIDSHLLRFRLTDNGQIIEAHHPINLTAPTHLDANRRGFTYTSGWLNANPGTFDAVPRVRIKYKMLDQERKNIKDSAYAGRIPQIRENIGNVLTSPIAAMATWIQNNLSWTQNWIDKPEGKFTDRIDARGLDKDLIVVTNAGGRRLFHARLQNVGGTVMGVPPPQTHIWELSVSGSGATAGTRNTFSTTVHQTRQRGGGTQIRIRSRYQVNTQ